MAKLQTMRGLQNFISEIRATNGKEEERARVDKELAKIRKKFSGSGNVSDYDKKKYVWKLLYIYMLGYPVEFGHKQASDLIAAGKYAEKQVGYMACSILLSENDEFLRLVINSIKNDITCRNEAFQCLALNFVGSVGGSEMATLLTTDVAALLTNGSVRPIVRKKAALALLRLLRKSADSAEEILPPEIWSKHIAALLSEPEIGVLLGATALLLGIVSRSYTGFEACVPKLVAVLKRMRAREVGPDYTYYGIASPWLQVKTLRVLQYFPAPEDAGTKRTLNEILKKIINSNEPVKNLNKNNAQQAIVLEAVSLALAIESEPDVLRVATGLLGKFIGMREPNLKYLGLESLMRLVDVPAVAETINKHQKSIIGALKEADISVRRRALDLLFAMANAENAQDIVKELLTYLTIADFSVREELVLKTAVLAEKFFPDLHWYVDTMITLIERAGEFATKDVWHSTVQLVTNHEELHEYAARQTVEALKRGANHDAMVGAATAIVGEYGELVAHETSNEDQFEMLNQLFLSASQEGKAQLMTAFLRISLREGLDPSSKARIEAVLEKHKRNMDAELQTRAVEYGGLAKNPDVGRRNVLPLPHWDKRKSLLMRRLAETQGEQAEKSGTPKAEAEAAETPTAVNGNGIEKQEEAVEEEPAPQPEPEPIPEKKQDDELDLLGIGESSSDANGLPKPSNPLDELLSGMALVPSSAPPPQQPPQYQPQQQQQYQQQYAPPQQQYAPQAQYQQTPNPQAQADPFAARSPASEAASPHAPQPPAVAAAMAAGSGSAPGSPLSQSGSPSGGGQDMVHYQQPASPLGPAPPQVLGNVGEWFRRLTAADSGILYEDTYLQVGVKQGFQGPSGQIQLYLGNKSAALTLGRLICAVPPLPSFAVQLGPVPPLLEPLKQVVVTLSFTAVAPFRDPPRLQLGYLLPGGAGGASQSLALPAVVTKFIAPPMQPPPPQLFFTHWRSFPGPPNKVTERVVRDSPLSRGAIAAIVGALRLADLQGFDPQPDNFVATGSFCFAPPGMAPQQALVLVRVEVDVGSHRQFQVTVASPDAQVAPAVLRLLCLHLAGTPSA